MPRFIGVRVEIERIKAVLQEEQANMSDAELSKEMGWSLGEIELIKGAELD